MYVYKFICTDVDLTLILSFCNSILIGLYILSFMFYYILHSFCFLSLKSLIYFIDIILYNELHF